MKVFDAVRSPKGILLLSACVALFAVLLVYTIPFSTEHIPIVRIADAPVELSLHAGDVLEQRVRVRKGTYSAVAFFSNDKALVGRKLSVTVKDSQGNIVTQGNRNSVSYVASANVMRIQVDFPWFSAEEEGVYVVGVSFLHGEDISIVSMERDSNTSAAQKLSINGKVRPALISVTFMKRTPTEIGVRQGVLAGAVCMIGIALISLFSTTRKKMIGAIALVIVLAPLSNLGYLYPMGDLGIADWDLYLQLHDSYRKAFLVHHTFPFWDPYICGGAAGLGDPEFPVFTPTFLLTMLFGSSLGLRLDIILSIIVGATGMLVLSRALGRSVEAGFLAALAVSFGTVSLLESAEGHVNILTCMWVPWVFWAWLSVYRKRMKPWVLSIFLSLMFLGGGVYLLIYTTLAFIVLVLLVPRRLDAVKIAFQAGLLALGLVAFKLVPVIFWLRQFPDRVYVPSSFSLPWITDILFGRYLHDAYIIPGQMSGWYEYGAYVGYGILALALIGLSSCLKNRIVRSLAIAGVLALLLSTLGSVLAPVLDQVTFFPRSNLSRVILFAVIPLGLLSAFGMDRLVRAFPRAGAMLKVLIIGSIAIDVLTLTYQLSEQAFVLPHVVPAISPAPYPIAYTPERYDEAGTGSRTTRTTDAYFAGYGTLAYCSVLGPQAAVRTIYDEGANGAVSVTDSRASVILDSWNYNRVRVHGETPVATQVVLNTNYADGWMVNGKRASVVSNRVAADVEAGSYELEFVYYAPGFNLGLGITIATLLFVFWKMRSEDAQANREGRQNHQVEIQ